MNAKQIRTEIQELRSNSEHAEIAAPKALSLRRVNESRLSASAGNVPRDPGAMPQADNERRAFGAKQMML